MMSVSIVIPVFNAEQTIGELCHALISVLSKSCCLEIVLVNDGSRDGSDDVIRALQGEHGEIITSVRLSRNFGEHSAVMAGLNHARGDYVVIMDDDFQNPPEEVPRLLAEIRKGYDVVYCRYPRKNDSLFRNLGSYLNGSMARIVLHKPKKLYLSSFKVMNRFLVNEVIKHDGPNPYLDAIILRTTSDIGTVEVRHDERRNGRSGYTLRKLVSLWGNMMVSYSLIPIRIMGVIGLLLTLDGLYDSGKTFFRDVLPALSDPSDLERLSSFVTFSRGIQLLATSIVGEYAGRIYLHLNRDPQFIVRELHSARLPRETADNKEREHAA